MHVQINMEFVLSRVISTHHGMDVMLKGFIDKHSVYEIPEIAWLSSVIISFLFTVLWDFLVAQK